MTDMTVAKTILQQLGGNKFITMTGARNFVGHDNALSFRLPRAANGINRVEITLEPSDTYKVEFGRVYGKVGGYGPRAQFEGVYADGLVELFEQTTKLYTKLF